MGLWKNGHNLWILQCENADQGMIDKVEEQQPTIIFLLRNGKITLLSFPVTSQELEFFLLAKR